MRSSRSIKPAAAYVARLGEGSRPAALSSLRTIAFALEQHRNYDVLAWETLEYSDASRLREILVDSGLSPSSINRTLSVFRGVIKEAWRLGLIKEDRRARVSAVQNTTNRRKAMRAPVPKDSIKALFDAVESLEARESIRLRAKAMLALAAGCGLRRAEVVSIRLEDMSLDTGRIKVRGKGDADRLAYVPPMAVSHIEKYLASRNNPGPYLFPSDRLDGAPCSPYIFDRLLRALAPIAGIDRVKPHDLRRAYATELLRKGVDLNSVSQAMGHKSVNTTRIYDLRTKDELQNKILSAIDVPG